jgi:hypothetical protein
LLDFRRARVAVLLFEASIRLGGDKAVSGMTCSFLGVVIGGSLMGVDGELFSLPDLAL